MKKISLLLLVLILFPSIFIYINKKIQKNNVTVINTGSLTTEWLDNGLNKETQTIFNKYGDTKFLKIDDLPNVPIERGYILPSIKGYEKQLEFFKNKDNNKYRKVKSDILREFFFNLFVDIENRGPSINIITFSSTPLKSAKIELNINGKQFKFENVYSSTNYQLEGYGIYENQMFINFSADMFKEFSKLKIGDLISVKIISNIGSQNYGYLYNPSSKGGLFIPLMKYNKEHTHLIKPNSVEDGFNPDEWDEYSLNKETHTIFNKYGDTKFLMDAQLNKVFVSSENIDSRYNLIEKEGKKYWITRESFPVLSSYLNELQLKNENDIIKINKNLISKFYIDITLSDNKEDHKNNFMNLVTFSKEEYPKITKALLIIGEDKINLENFYINSPNYLGDKSKLYTNEIKVPFTQAIFTRLSTLKYQNKITLKLISKEETYEYTYLYEPNEKGGLHIALMKYNDIHNRHMNKQVSKEEIREESKEDNPLLQKEEPLPVPSAVPHKLEDITKAVERGERAKAKLYEEKKEEYIPKKKEVEQKDKENNIQEKNISENNEEIAQPQENLNTEQPIPSSENIGVEEQTGVTTQTSVIESKSAEKKVEKEDHIQNKDIEKVETSNLDTETPKIIKREEQKNQQIKVREKKEEIPKEKVETKEINNKAVDTSEKDKEKPLTKVSDVSSVE